jgi:hypothetical protein
MLCNGGRYNNCNIIINNFKKKDKDSHFSMKNKINLKWIKISNVYANGLIVYCNMNINTN